MRDTEKVYTAWLGLEAIPWAGKSDLCTGTGFTEHGWVRKVCYFLVGQSNVCTVKSCQN